MEVPPADHPAWRDILTGKDRHQLDFFAAKILLGWQLLKVDNDPSDDTLTACTQALQHLFAQNAELPCVQRDLEKIFGTGERQEFVEEVPE